MTAAPLLISCRHPLIAHTLSLSPQREGSDYLSCYLFLSQPETRALNTTYSLYLIIAKGCIYTLNRVAIFLNRGSLLQKITKKTKIPRVTDEGRNSQKQLSGPVEKKRRRRRELLYPYPKLVLGLVHYRPYSKVDVSCKKNGVLDIS